MPKGYDRSQTSVHFMNYHFAGCPKYRKPVLVDAVELRLKDLVERTASELGVIVLALEMIPDHVHLFIQANTVLAPNSIVDASKGYTSHELARGFP